VVEEGVVADLAQARLIALALPETVEQDHHGMPSFRVGGKILATVPDDEHIRIMLAEDEIRAVVAEYPEVCAPSYWGKKLACVLGTLAPATPNLVDELLTEAWLSKAPRSLVERQGRHGDQPGVIGRFRRWSRPTILWRCCRADRRRG
jgi:hypothetical protein